MKKLKRAGKRYLIMVKFLQMFIKCTNVALAHNLDIEPITILPRTDECMSSGTYTTLEFDHKTIRAIAYAHS